MSINNLPALSEKNVDLMVTRAHRKSPNRIFPKNLSNQRSKQKGDNVQNRAQNVTLSKKE